MGIRNKNVVLRESDMLPEKTWLLPRGKIPDRYEVQYDDSDYGIEDHSVFRIMVTIIRC